MELITTGIDYVGIIIFLIGALFLTVQAFEKGTGWGLGMLFFFGILWPVYVIKFWKDASFWFFWALAGALIIFIF